MNLIRFAQLSVIGGLLACKPTQFQGVEKPASINKISFPLSCKQEKSKSAQLNSAETSVINIAKNCSSDSKSDKTPTDIVFVIDITASMQDSINTVKNGVERFAVQLRQDKGWDARFAAVAFRDQVMQTVPFTDEKNLASVLRGWMANGGEDPQEAGQAGLAAALQLIANDYRSASGRTDSSKIILFIGDAIAYALNGNHNDFSTTQLEQLFAAIPADLKSQMRFYHSTAKQVEGCVLVTPFGCARTAFSTELAAHGQFTTLASKIALPGRAFEFPFTESIMLSEFIDEFVPGQSCALQTAVARDSAGKEIARTDASGTLKLTPGSAARGFQVETERCCSSADAKAKCQPVKQTVNFSLN